MSANVATNQSSPIITDLAESSAKGRMDPQEQELILSLRGGESRAYQRVLEEYGPRLLALARRMLRNDNDAEDALQDAMINAFRAVGRFEGNSALYTWLHRIVVTSCLMKLRSAKRRDERPIDDLLPAFDDTGHRVDPCPAWCETGPDICELAETRQLVRRCIDQLPETYRTVLLLRDIEELDTAETARLLEVNEGVVKTRLHRARQALRALLDPHFRGGTS